MGKKRSLSEAQRAQIVILRQEGYIERAKSERFAVSKTAVHQGQWSSSRIVDLIQIVRGAVVPEKPPNETIF